MASLFLIRHAEPSVTGVLPGRVDAGLSAAGRAQAAALAGIGVEATFSSPLRRALETADFVRGRRLSIVPEFSEIDHGAWAGRTWPEIEAGWPEAARGKLADWLGVAAPGGETWAQFSGRVGSAWRRIRLEPGPIAVVAHQGVNAVLAQLIAGRDPVSFNQGYGEVIQLEYGNE